jgi:hypothetical protein
MVTHWLISQIHNIKSHRQSCLCLCHAGPGEEEVQLCSFLSSVMDGGERSPSHPDCFTSCKNSIKYQEEEAGWAPEPASTLWKKRKLSCNFQELMNSLISSTGHSPVILTKLSHLTECYTHTKIHWLPHKQFHFHRGTFSPWYIHTPIYTEFTVANIMLPPNFH